MGVRGRPKYSFQRGDAENAEEAQRRQRRSVSLRFRAGSFSSGGGTLSDYAGGLFQFFGAGFVMDNRGLILEDSRVRAATAENVSLIFGHTYWWPYGESGLFRPLTTLSYLFNYAILGNGERPAGYHWINYGLHAVNVLLVYALGLRLLGEWRRAAWIAALWAVHPVITESVTNIVGRADLLAGVGVLGGLLLYLKSTDHSGWRRWVYLGRAFGGHRDWGVLEGIGRDGAAGDWALRSGLVETAAAGTGADLGIGCHDDADRGDAVSALGGTVVRAGGDFSVLRQPDRGRRIRSRQAHGVTGDGEICRAAGVAGAALFRLFVGADSAGGRRCDGLARVRGAGGGTWGRRAAVARQPECAVCGGRGAAGVSADVEPFVSDRHDYGGALSVSAIDRVCGGRSRGSVCRGETGRR